MRYLFFPYRNGQQSFSGDKMSYLLTRHSYHASSLGGYSYPLMKATSPIIYINADKWFEVSLFPIQEWATEFSFFSRGGHYPRPRRNLINRLFFFCWIWISGSLHRRRPGRLPLWSTATGSCARWGTCAGVRRALAAGERPAPGGCCYGIRRSSFCLAL